MQKILLVDDDEHLRQLLRMTLNGAEVQVEEAGNSEEALLQMQQCKPDIVVLDVMMPGMQDGVEVCRQIKANPALQQTRVILLSAKGQHTDIAQGLAAGAECYLTKPFSPLHLLEMVRSAA